MCMYISLKNKPPPCVQLYTFKLTLPFPVFMLTYYVNAPQMVHAIYKIENWQYKEIPIKKIPVKNGIFFTR